MLPAEWRTLPNGAQVADNYKSKKDKVWFLAKLNAKSPTVLCPTKEKRDFYVEHPEQVNIRKTQEGDLAFYDGRKPEAKTPPSPAPSTNGTNKNPEALVKQVLTDWNSATTALNKVAQSLAALEKSLM